MIASANCVPARSTEPIPTETITRLHDLSSESILSAVPSPFMSAHSVAPRSSPCSLVASAMRLQKTGPWRP